MLTGFLVPTHATHHADQQSSCEPRDRDATSRHIELRNADDIENVVAALLTDLEPFGYVPRDMFAIQLALQEALTNAIRHGNRNDPAKRVQLRYRIAADSIWVEIEDEGQGFVAAEVADPLAAENLDRPCGRGLLLIKSYMTRVVFNERGNRVTLFRRRQEAA